MEMPPKFPFPRALTIWLVSVPTLLLVVWLSGHLYWQVRIGRAISALQDPDTDQKLVRIGTRGFPQFVDALERALARNDEKRARALTRGLVHLIAGAFDANSPADQRILQDLPRFQSREEMERIVREYRDLPAKHPGRFPPWWMWWKGDFE
jgi:hypothetical protein